MSDNEVNNYEVEDIRVLMEQNKWKDCCQSALEGAVERIDDFRGYRRFRDNGFTCGQCGVHWEEDLDAEEGGAANKSSYQPTWEMIGVLLSKIPQNRGEVVD